MSADQNNDIKLDLDMNGAFKKALDGPLNLIVPLGSYHIDQNGKHAKGLNEVNPGIGVSVPLSQDTTAFVMAYNNSYKDPTIVAGIQYTPFKATAGALEAKFGVAAGVAYTKDGSYAKAAPQLSHGNMTLMGGLYTSVEHKPSGVGLEATIIPPGPAGVTAVALNARFQF